MLLKAADIASVPGVDDVFDDVPDGHPAEDWIRGLKMADAAVGCSTTRFCPGRALTKARFAQMLSLTFNLVTIPSIVIQPGPDEGKDTYFGTGSVGGRDGRPDSDELRIGGWADNWTSFIEFDLCALPDNVQIVSAKLHLYNRSSTNANNGKLYRVTESWIESDPSDTSSPASVDMGMPWQAVPNVDWWIVDVTDVLSDWHDGTYPNYGFMMQGQYNGNNHVKSFTSSDDPDDASLRPKLVVEYILLH